LAGAFTKLRSSKIMIGSLVALALSLATRRCVALAKVRVWAVDVPVVVAVVTEVACLECGLLMCLLLLLLMCLRLSLLLVLGLLYALVLVAVPADVLPLAAHPSVLLLLLLHSLCLAVYACCCSSCWQRCRARLPSALLRLFIDLDSPPPPSPHPRFCDPLCSA